jgi:hypothetical protein
MSFSPSMTFSHYGVDDGFARTQGAGNYTLKYYRSNLTLEDIFLWPIDSVEAVKQSHFRLKYDSRGTLISIEYVYVEAGETEEPMENLPAKASLMGFYRGFDWENLKPFDEIGSNGSINQHHFRVYLDSTGILERVEEYADRTHRLSVVYRRKAIDWRSEDINISKGSTSLLEYNPLLYSLELSALRKGWVIRNYYSDVRLVKTEVQDRYKYPMYSYIFDWQEIPKLGMKLVRSTYYTSKMERVGIMEFEYNKDGRLDQRKVFNNKYQLILTDRFEYDKDKKATIFYQYDNKGNLISRKTEHFILRFP